MLSHLEKMWWPEDGITKGEIINYFHDVSPWLLPHFRGRAVVLTRYPGGWQGDSFYQKNMQGSAPDWMRLWQMPASSGRSIAYAVLESTAALLWTVNLGAFEIHPFLSPVDHPEYPDFAVFDLDPMEASTWDDVLDTAIAVHRSLEMLGLRAYPKTSGATGLQIYVPVEPRYTYAQIRDFCLAVAKLVIGVMPERVTTIRSVKDRGGKLYLDCLQNALGKTLAGVYCVRPRPHAPVSMPVSWEEVYARNFTPQSFTVRNALTRLYRMGDLHAGTLTMRQSLDQALLRLQGGGVRA
jgi:bifunctional non-homologous end joining protein LigD